MNRMLATALLLVFLSPALVTAGTVSGQVTNASGKPVSMVLVSVGGQSDLSDVHGKFRLTGVPDGQQQLQAKVGNAVKELAITVGPNTTQNITLP